MIIGGQIIDMVMVHKSYNQLESKGLRRVATLYRVSTKGQLDGNDIPMQERSCRGFIDKQDDWTLVKEYTERGVSGYKVSAANRDVIQQAKDDAEKGLYDILLVFMFDRLGRKDDETPFVLEWFVKQGIEMWSVIEGQQKIEQHSDRLMNYLRFWQSSGESRKTSDRVNEKHIQMVEDGIFRGGGIPYGFSGIDSGVKNKKGKPLLKLVINEEEAKIVRQIYSLVHEEGYGQLRIAKLLNENNVPTRKAKKWGAATVNAILKNPIYKGVMRYRKEEIEVYSLPNSEIAIVSEEVWSSVQSFRDKRNPKTYSDTEERSLMSTKGSLLLIGLARCGCCRSRLTSTTFVNKYKDAKGEIRKYNHNKSYRCSGKQQGKTICTGQATFSANKVEGFVLKQLNKYLDELQNVDFTKEINSLKKNNSDGDEKKLRKLQNQIEEEYSELSVLSAEVPKSIMGKSSFKPDLLNQLIEEKEKSINELRLKINQLESDIVSKKVEINEIETLQKCIPEWKDIFSEASIERKKIMLGLLIDEVLVSRETIKIELRIQIKQILVNLSSVTRHSGRAPS
ncbi:Recombinase [compost metagenome]